MVSTRIEYVSIASVCRPSNHSNLSLLGFDQLFHIQTVPACEYVHLCDAEYDDDDEKDATCRR